MAARSAKSKEVIRISCEGAPGPGLAWTIIIEFRPTSRGYSVWVYEDNVMTDRPKWIRVASCACPLTWRTAYDSLVANENLRVFGDFWFETWIEGLPVWAASILRLVFIVDDEGPHDYRAMGNLLVGFTDQEIQNILPDTGLDPFQDSGEEPTAFQKLVSLASSAAIAGLIGRSLQEIRSELGAGPEAKLDDLESMLSERADEIKHSLEQRRISEFIQGAKEQQTLGSPDDASHQKVVRSDLREWESLSQGPLPDDLGKQIDLILCWLFEAEKPRGGYAVQSIHEGSEWPVLMWLLGARGDQLPVVLAELKHRKPEEAMLLVDEVMRRGKKEAYYFEGPNRFSGWAQNVIGRHVHAAHVGFALKFQSFCDSLEIPIDDKYRIGELPYLPPRKP